MAQSCIVDQVQAEGAIACAGAGCDRPLRGGHSAYSSDAGDGGRAAQSAIHEGEVAAGQAVGCISEGNRPRNGTSIGRAGAAEVDRRDGRIGSVHECDGRVAAADDSCVICERGLADIITDRALVRDLGGAERQGRAVDRHPVFDRDRLARRQVADVHVDGFA